MVVLNSSASILEDKLSPEGYFITGVYLVVLGIVAICGNSLVILVVLMKRMLCKSFNHLIFNLAVVDLAVAVSAYPMSAASNFANRWLFGNMGCVAAGYIVYLLTIVSMNTLTVLAIFRYIFICLPQYNWITRVQYAKYVLGGIWLHALAWTSLPLLGWSNFCPEPYGTACTLNWSDNDIAVTSYALSSIFTCYLLQVTVITFCYTKITFQARSLRFGITSSEGFYDMDKLLLYQKLQVERNVTTICIVMVLFFFTAWTPYALFSTLSIFDIDLPVQVTCIPNLFAKLSCAFNPIIYTVGSSRFRRALRSILPGCVRVNSPNVKDWEMKQIRDREEEEEEDDKVFGFRGADDTLLADRSNVPFKNHQECTADVTKHGVYIGPATISTEVQATVF